MALPAVEMGIAYPIDLSALLASSGDQSNAIGYDTYHTITCTLDLRCHGSSNRVRTILISFPPFLPHAIQDAPDSHVQKGVPIVPIDPMQSGYLTATPARSGTGNSVELGFSNTLVCSPCEVLVF